MEMFSSVLQHRITLGDKFREKMTECEVSQGFFKYDISEIRRRRLKFHGSDA